MVALTSFNTHSVNWNVSLTARLCKLHLSLSEEGIPCSGQPSSRESLQCPLMATVQLFLSPSTDPVPCSLNKASHWLVSGWEITAWSITYRPTLCLEWSRAIPRNVLREVVHKDHWPLAIALPQSLPHWNSFSGSWAVTAPLAQESLQGSTPACGAQNLCAFWCTDSYASLKLHPTPGSNVYSLFNFLQIIKPYNNVPSEYQKLNLLTA